MCGRRPPRRRDLGPQILGQVRGGCNSTTFWWRRCTLQPARRDGSTLPCVSARIWTSMWRGLITAAQVDVESPNADSASRARRLRCLGQRRDVDCRRIPRPRPRQPHETTVGIACLCAGYAARRRMRRSRRREDAGRASRAAAIARDYYRSAQDTSGWGRDVMPAFAQAAASSGFSDRTRIRGTPRRRTELRRCRRFVDRQVGAQPGGRSRRSVGLVGLEAVQRIRLVGVDSDGADTELVAARHARMQCAIGNQTLGNHLVPTSVVR